MHATISPVVSSSMVCGVTKQRASTQPEADSYQDRAQELERLLISL
jgi:hypothetical protein